MRRYWSIAAATLGFLLISEQSEACRMRAKLDLNDVKFADVVLVGRISNYRIIRDIEFRRKMLASPKLPADMRKFYEGSNGLMSDYARFDVRVDRVLSGDVPPNITVTWDNSTFGEPEEMAAGAFLIALRKPASKMPPLRGPSATVIPNREPERLTLLQAPCAAPFMFKNTSDEARAVEEILRVQSR